MLPLGLDIAVSMFSLPISFRELTGSYVDREWVEVETDSGKFSGRIAPATDDDSELFEEGEVSSGAKVIHVVGTTELFFPDVNETAEKKKQTYIDFQGDVWRVKSVSNRSHDGSHKRYGAVRHMVRQGS